MMNAPSKKIIEITLAYAFDHGEWILQFGDKVFRLGSLSPAALKAIGSSAKMLGGPAMIALTLYQEYARRRDRAEAREARAARNEAEQRAEEAQQREQEALERGNRLETENQQCHRQVIQLSIDEIPALRMALGLEDTTFNNIACVGRVSAGKTSFINSCRGLHPRSRESNDVDPECRPGEVGLEETTEERTKYLHPDIPKLIFWDMPGTGGMAKREWDYYTDYNLGLYDYLLVLHDMPFSQTECNIVKMHQEQTANLPNPPRIFIIRTKADESLRSMRRDGDTRLPPEELIAQFKEHNTNSVRRLLTQNGLNHDIPIYHISSDALCAVVTGVWRRKRIKFIDELKLLQDLGLLNRWEEHSHSHDFNYDGSPLSSDSEDDTEWEDEQAEASSQGASAFETNS